MSICGEPHPDQPGIRCEMPDSNHEWHTAIDLTKRPVEGIDWRNEDYTPAQRTRTKSQRQEEARVLRERVREYNGGPPVEALEAWHEKKGAWIEGAKKTLHRYCREHAEPFTTPEDIWPLLESPGEMRAFTVVVQHALRHRWIAETGSRRLRGTYRTADGVEFEMNKIVPVYASRISLPPDL